VADRYHQRNVLLTTQAVVGLTAVLAAFLIATGVVQVWQLMAVTLIEGCAFAFNVPARQALIAELVPPEDLANAVALYNAGLNFCRVAGPAIAGALLSLPLIGAAGVFALMAALYLLVLAITGAASAAYASLNNTLLMSSAPPEYHGRVMGVYMMTFAAMPLSSLPASRLAEAIGLPGTLLLCGVLSTASVILGTWGSWSELVSESEIHVLSGRRS